MPLERGPHMIPEQGSDTNKHSNIVEYINWVLSEL